MAAQSFELDILVQGYPGKTVCHGGLGWSTIALLRGHGRIVLIDVGSFGVRRVLIDQLVKRGLRPTDVTDVVLTHSHYDHSVNWTLFSSARVAIGASELAWAVEVPPGASPVPELYVRELQRSPQLRLVRDGDALALGLTAHAAPGHTPGHLVYVLSGRDHDIVFTGDAAKNRAELLSRSADLTEDAAASGRSFDRIWELWRQRPGTVLVPGHDVPMVLEEGRPAFIGKREAVIRAWFGETLDQLTTFELVA